MHFTDSSSARQLCNRQGVGKIRHLSGKVLWVQSQVQSGAVGMVQMPTAYNVSDIGSKSLGRRRLLALMCELGMVSAEAGQAIGQEELEDLRASHTNSRDVTKLAKTILRLTTVLGLVPTGLNAQGQCEDHSVNSGDNETLWIWLSIFLLAVAWIGFAVAAYKLWLRMNQRVEHNELQQAETDTFMGHQRDLLDEQRANLHAFRTRYNNYVRQTDQGLTNNYDGLVHHGGFVRYNELTRQQRSDMFAQERSNQLLFRARQVAPDTTDDPSGPGVYAAEAAGSAEPPVPMEDSQMESVEEEEPTSDAEGLEDDSNTREGELTRIIRHLRDQVNEALASEHFEDATDIQMTLTTVLEAARFSPHLTLDIARRVTGTYQRLYRRARNRGDAALAGVYHAFAENLHQFL